MKSISKLILTIMFIVTFTSTTLVYADDLSSLFTSVNKIIFVAQIINKENGTVDPIEVEIVNPDEITKIIESIDVTHLETKVPCRCGHLEYIDFYSDKYEFRVTVCSHCFDIINNGKVQYYKMPNKFYQLFSSYINKAK